VLSWNSLETSLFVYHAGNRQCTDLAVTGDDVERKMIDKTIEPFLADLKGKGCNIELFENGGLSNYYAVWVHENRSNRTTQRNRILFGGRITITLAYWGLMPSLWTRSRKFILPGAMDYLKPAKLLASVQLHRSLKWVWPKQWRGHPYQILSPSELNQRIPDDIRPYEYCPSPEPWNLFSTFCSPIPD